MLNSCFAENTVFWNYYFSSLPLSLLPLPLQYHAFNPQFSLSSFSHFPSISPLPPPLLQNSAKRTRIHHTKLPPPTSFPRPRQVRPDTYRGGRGRHVSPVGGGDTRGTTTDTQNAKPTHEHAHPRTHVYIFLKII